MKALPKGQFGDDAVRWHVSSCRLYSRRCVLVTLVAANSRKVRLYLGWRQVLAVVWGLLVGFVRA